MLARNSLLPIQLLVAQEIIVRLVKAYAQLLDVGIRYRQIVGCRRDSRLPSRILHNSLLIVGLGLSYLQLVFRTLNHDKRIPGMYKLEIIETDLLDESLYTRVDGDHIAPYLGIVGIFHISQMDKFGAHPCQTADYDCDNYDIT